MSVTVGFWLRYTDRTWKWRLGYSQKNWKANATSPETAQLKETFCLKHGRRKKTPRISHVNFYTSRLTRCLGPLKVACKFPNQNHPKKQRKIFPLAHLSTLESQHSSPHFLKNHLRFRFFRERKAVKSCKYLRVPWCMTMLIIYILDRFGR